MMPLIPLVWVLPTLIAVIIVEASQFTGIFLPVPFFFIIICVIIAGSRGGKHAGVIAGFIAALFVFRSYFLEFGPHSLTGGIPQATIGSLLLLGIGLSLGNLKDQRDASIQSLRTLESTLKTSLESTIQENEQKTTQIAESEARLNTAIRIAGIGNFSFDPVTSSCNYCSDQHAAHYGLTAHEFMAMVNGPTPNLSFIHPEDREIFEETIQRINAGESETFEYRALKPNGEIIYLRQIEEPIFDTNGHIIESVGASINLTDLRLAEASVRQSQRIEAIGTLTGGIAHDFNNLLAVILGNLELSLVETEEAERNELTQSAIKATLRGAALTKNLLSFARRAHLEPKRLNLNQLVQNTMAWGARVLPASLTIENALSVELWDVELDQTSAENALINILLNSRDSMPDGGKITIETSNVRIGEKHMIEHSENIEPGRYVMLAISDTGHGIPEDKISKIFEPFFTDKPVGSGSGLGLSMVQGFIKQSGGVIRVQSEVGVGSTFKLYFKAADHLTDAQLPIDDKTAPAFTGLESVLIAEDEVEVMRILKRTLEDAGYNVTAATSGDEALTLFTSAKQFDLLLTDVVMPGTLLGPALAQAARLIDPDLPCIFLSGYASEATVHGNGLRPSDVRLMKPVNRTDLLAAVKAAIETAKNSD